MMLFWAFLIGVVVDSIPVFAPPREHGIQKDTAAGRMD